MNPTIQHPFSRPFSLRALTPTGWYENQLRIQAAGLSGQLDTFWPDIKDSKWIGGNCEGWERMPYWLDGFIPLAALLRDEDKLSRARRYVDAILARQQQDGWLCPTDSPEARRTYDVWALFLILKVLVVWEDATGDPRIEEAVSRALRCLNRHIDSTTLFNWAATRWYECLISIYWLYDRRPEAWLVDLSLKLRAQGFDWCGFFHDWPMKQPNEQGHWSQMNHVVNNAMMLKSPALTQRLGHPHETMADAYRMASSLDAYHGTATGVFTGDECLAGLNPSQGTELCSVAEYMYSLQFLVGAQLDAAWADRLEKISYNAWPATFDPAMWTHQYVQQANQMQATVEEDRIYRTNRADANTFGLEPDFGCCTANLSQGWPKLSQSVFYQTAEGIAIHTWLPVTLETTYEGGALRIAIDTDYPFRDTVNVHIESACPNAFALDLRIPSWAEGATATVDGEAISCKAGAYLNITRRWENSKITLRFPMQARIKQRPNGLYAVERGPLVYALRIGEAWTQYNQDRPGHELPHGDFEVRPTSPWNYGLCIANDTPDIQFEERPMTDRPFSPAGAPVVAKVLARQIDWPIQHGCASPTPGKDLLGVPEQVELIPYGCTNLRMTELPLVSKD